MVDFPRTKGTRRQLLRTEGCKEGGITNLTRENQVKFQGMKGTCSCLPMISTLSVYACTERRTRQAGHHHVSSKTAGSREEVGGSVEDGVEGPKQGAEDGAQHTEQYCKEGGQLPEEGKVYNFLR